MESPKQILERFSARLSLNPGLSSQEIASFEADLPRPLPLEIRELLQFASGFAVDPDQISKSKHSRHNHPLLFTGTQGVGFDVFPYLVDVLPDGCGNFWVVDVLRSGLWGSVFYICHDPPVVVFQARDLSSFLLQLLEPAHATPHRALRHVHDSAVGTIWKDDPWIISVSGAKQSADHDLKVFAETVSNGFGIADLRSQEIGSGFCWGRAGSDSEILRADEELMFALEKKRPGIMARIFSRH